MMNTSINEVLKSLETLYIDGKNNEARDLLVQHKNKLDPGLFHYNYGTLLIKSGNTAAGRFHLEKALQSGYSNSKTKNNLKVVKESLQVNDISTSEVFVDQLVNTSKQLPNEAFLSMTLILILLILLGYKFSIVKNKILLSAGLLICLLPLCVKYGYLDTKELVVSLKDTVIYEGPSSIYEKKGELKAGSKVVIGEKRRKFYYIDAPEFLAGWVKKADLGIL